MAKPLSEMHVGVFRGAWRGLSNFAPCRIIGWDGYLIYPSVEHAYQAAKLAPEEPDTALWQGRIQQATTAGRAKTIGRHVPLRTDWEAIKLRVMKSLLYQKFQQAPFRALLLSSRGMALVEGNDWGDRYWGVCNGVGENHLGRLLMEIRQEIQNAEAPR